MVSSCGNRVLVLQVGPLPGDRKDTLGPHVQEKLLLNLQGWCTFNHWLYIFSDLLLSSSSLHQHSSTQIFVVISRNFNCLGVSDPRLCIYTLFAWYVWCTPCCACCRCLCGKFPEQPCTLQFQIRGSVLACWFNQCIFIFNSTSE